MLPELSCNFVRWQEHFLERSIRRSGLVAKQTELGFDRIAYWEGGTGPTLLLLHGFGADGTFGWSEQIPVLAKHFHLIVPDLLWFGESESSQYEFSVEHQARAIKNLLAYLKVKQFQVAGISYGGIVALTLMSELPNQIKKAIIVSSPGPIYTQEDYQQLRDRFQIQSASEIVLPTDYTGLDRLLKVAYQRPPYIPMIARGDVIDFVKDRPGGERAKLLEHIVNDLERLKQQIKKFHGEVLIIWGNDDELFPVELATRLKNYFGDRAELKIIKNARHAPNIEYSAEFNKAVLSFFNQ